MIPSFMIPGLGVPVDALDETKFPRRCAEDMKCGDVFAFRGSLFCVLSSFTDQRHTQTILTCVSQDNAKLPFERVTVVRAFRTAKLPLISHFPLELKVVNMEQEEISDEAVEDLERKRSNME